MMARQFSDTTLSDLSDSYTPSWNDALRSKASTASTLAATGRCYTPHPPLKLVKGGEEFRIYGGSCSTPVVLDADIYIGFDHMPDVKAPYPWNPVQAGPLKIHFPIPDMGVPSSPEEFKKMVSWVCNQLQSGKKIHAGCIGGHGRTGTFLAAVTAEFTGELDAIVFVREHYCKKAVESGTQIKFLAKHYGIKEVKGSKAGLMYPADKNYPAPTSTKKSVYESLGAWKTSVASKASNVVPLPAANKVAFSKSTRTITPMPSRKYLWNDE